MTNDEKQEIKDAIEFYEKKKWDWSGVVEFLVRKATGTLQPEIIRTRIGFEGKAGKHVQTK